MKARRCYRSLSVAMAGALWLLVPNAHAEPSENQGDALPNTDAPAPAVGTQSTVTAERGEEPDRGLKVRFQRLLNRPGGLTANEVSSRAVATSYNVKSKEHEVAAAAAEVDKALTRYFPELTLGARYTRLSPVTPPSVVSGPGSLVVSPMGQEGQLPSETLLVGVPFSALSFPVILNQYYLQAGVTVPLSDYFLRVNHGVRAAEDLVEAAKLNARAEKLNGATCAKFAYYRWVRARMQEVVAEQTLAQAAEHLKNAKLGLDAGRLSKADVMSAEAQVASAELLLSQTRRMSATTEDLIRTQMHDPTGHSYAIGEDILGAPISDDTGGSLDRLFAEARERRLELQEVDKSLAALGRTRRIATANAYPRLSAFGNAYYANPNPRLFPQKEEWKASWDVGVQLVWVPNAVLSSRADTTAIDEQRAKLEDDRGALSDAVRAQVNDAYQAVKEAAQSVKSAERGLAAAEEAYRVRRLLFDHGRATNVELTDAATTLLRARLEMIHAKVNVLTARVSLEHAVGRDAR